MCVYKPLLGTTFRCGLSNHQAATARMHSAGKHTPSPPTKSFDFRGFDSSRLLILRGGNSHVR